jgi:diacylglycerol kinase family enzyme
VRSFTALVNPLSGGGSAALKWEPLESQLQRAGAEVKVVLTRSREHAVSAAAKAADAGDVVVAVGGDGLVRDVATGVVPVGGTMAIVPAGRGNDLAAGLDLPTDHAALGGLLLNGPVRRVDVLAANGVFVPGNVYTGLDAVATKIINENRRIPAKLLYRLAPVIALARWRPVCFTVTTGGAEAADGADVADGMGGATLTTTTERGHMVVVANSGRYGHGLHIVPTAVLDDGRLDVLTVGAVPKYKIAAFMGETKTGEHAKRPEVRLSSGTTVTISADSPVPVCADGDDIGMLPVTVSLRPGALNLIAPPSN